MKKILTVVGARPQFIKAAPVSRELRKSFKEILVHTGQHYDANMSDIFFDELHIPKPDYNLEIGSGGHGEQTGQMLIELEKVVLKENPDYILIYGDTNSTLAGALVGTKLHIPVLHVEAGLRSYNRRMPEEINRVLADQVSDVLFCPTETAAKNLKKEDITKGVYNVGDVMYDAVLYNTAIALQKSNILKNLDIAPKEYVLCTIHRAENTDDKNRLTSIFNALIDSDLKIILPLHPRTKKYLKEYNLLNEKAEKNIKIIDPVGPLDMIALEKGAKLIITDSGGVQKEAYFMEVPCVTLRDETEWVETVESGNNAIVGADYDKIRKALKDSREFNKISKEYFGDGMAAKKIRELLTKL
jgi:UDP-GlcNAc3NAcA epimerase